MKSVEKYIVENYGKRTSSKLMSEGIPKLFLKIEAVKKQIDKLTAERKQKFGGAYAAKVNSETDANKRNALVKPILDITKKINALQKNLTDLYDMEEKYIKDLGKDDELVVSEDKDLGHQDDEPGMLRADLSIIERYAEELGEMMEKFEVSGEEVDFPHWWQAKIIKAKDYLVSAKHYLRAELEKGQN
jgi:hypothetical protein